MRTDKERIAAMHKRAAELEREKRGRTVRLIQAASVALCVLFLAGISLAMPKLAAVSGSDAAAQGMRASIFSENSALGYIVIGILAFLLGVCVTIFCFQLRKWQKDRDSEEKL